METKYVFVTTGIIPSHCNGVISSSLARLLKARGFSVTIKKFDPCLNIETKNCPSTGHDECYLTEDGEIVDYTIGLYERLADITTTRANYNSLGRIYQRVFDKERRGEYQDKVIRITPHITDEIKRDMIALGSSGEFDFVIIEIGGVTGNIDSLPYIESMRQLRRELGNNSLCIHIADSPYNNSSDGLIATHIHESVKKLQGLGIQPEILVLHTEQNINQDTCINIASLCNISPDDVVQFVDAPSVYEVPIKLYEQKLDEKVMRHTNVLTKREADLTDWLGFLNKMYTAERAVSICLVGQCAETADAYQSLRAALEIASAYNNCKLNLTFIQSENIHDGNAGELLGNIAGVIIASDCGQRGVEGKISAAKWCRQHNIPTLGINTGMHCMLIEYARNVSGLYDTVISKCNSSIDMANGCDSHNCLLNKDSQLAEIYDTTNIKERHNNQYESDNKYRNEFEKSGMHCVGFNPINQITEAIELPENRWYIGVQYHPEYSNTVLKPHPLFLDFVNTAISYQELN